MLRRTTAALQSLGHLGYLGLLSLIFPELRALDPLIYFFVAWPLSWALRIAAHLSCRRESKLSPEDRRFMRRYAVFEFAAQFNPWLQAQALRQLAGQSTAGTAVQDAARFEPQRDYVLPFRGKWHVLNGGVTRESSHSWDIATQRYAYDFVIKDETGSTHRGAGDRVEDFYCHGQELLAPAEGIVHSVQDGLRDYPRAGKGRIDVFVRDIRGNHVLIKHSETEYSLLAHLKRGSIRVKQGDQVTAGQPVAQCGNSGLSTEPHLHFHLQSTPDFYAAAGLPIRFSQYVEFGLPGSVRREKGYLERGMDCEAFGN